MNRFSPVRLTALLIAALAPTAQFAHAAQFAIKFDKNVAVPASDGLVLRANVFRPDAAGKFPVIMAHGPYGKDWHFADGYKQQWEELMRSHPEVCQGSSCRFMRWETVDPERWVPEGYVVVHVDSRGSGKSPGYLDPSSMRETFDFYEAIEWAAAQPWSSGKVGLLGISYYAANQWQVAALRPPHLTAMLPWEGYSDHYRDSTHHDRRLCSRYADHRAADGPVVDFLLDRGHGHLRHLARLWAGRKGSDILRSE